MRVWFWLFFLLTASVANAQQCSQCTAADLCIREYTRSITKLKADHVRAIAAQRKNGAQLSQADQGSYSVQTEIDNLKNCLGKIR
jgi:hypothetical protein